MAWCLVKHRDNFTFYLILPKYVRSVHILNIMSGIYSSLIYVTTLHQLHRIHHLRTE
jgi:hypothetical protein